MTATQIATPTRWRIDKTHSSASFEVRHSGVSIFRGGFADVDATLDFSSGEPRLEGAVRADSVQVADETLKGHLLSPDFFDAERHPEIKFTSTGFRRADDGSLTIEGELELKGHTEQTEAEGSLNHVEADITGNARYGLHLETTLDRTAFGISWNAELPSGGLVLDNDVKLVVHLELTPEV